MPPLSPAATKVPTFTKEILSTFKLDPSEKMTSTHRPQLLILIICEKIKVGFLYLP